MTRLDSRKPCWHHFFFFLQVSVNISWQLNEVLWVCVGNEDFYEYVFFFPVWQWQTRTTLVMYQLFFPPWRVRVPLFRLFINGNCCATPVACRGSPAPTRRKLARQSEDALGNKLKHYLWGWQVPWQWTMTSPKLRPLTIYSQQCGTSHIRAVRPGVFLHLRPPAANYMIWCLQPRQVRSPDSERARRYLQNNNSCCCPWAKCSTGSWLVAALRREKQKELVQCAEKLVLRS